MMNVSPLTDASPPCCWACWDAIRDRLLAAGQMPQMWFITCKHCGDKRCPCAKNHRNPCHKALHQKKKASPCI